MKGQMCTWTDAKYHWSLVEYKLKTKGYHLTPIRMAQKNTMPNTGKEAEQLIGMQNIMATLKTTY